MKHFGDITKIKGSEVPLTHIVCGGSPCQDLSVAGKRAGLAGERSGLFMEQIRIIKEMRDESYKELSMQGSVDPSRIVPRFMVWENVPGAFSSNGGEDFRVVLEETAKVADENATIPRLATGKDGKQKWSKSGCIMGDGWSIAWRLHDAQFWGKSILSPDGRVVKKGTPQRRRRIALVADFGGDTAPEILFERKGMSGDITESGEEGQGLTTDIEGSVGKTIGFTNRGFESGEVTETLRSDPHGAYPMVATGITCLNDQGGQQMGVSEDVSQDQTLMTTINQVNILNPSDSQGNQVADSNGVYPTLRGSGGAGYQQGYLLDESKVYGISSYDSNAMKSDNPHSGVYEADTSRTLDLNGGNPACNQGGMVVVQSVGFDSFNQAVSEEVASTIRCAEGGDSAPKVVAFTQNQRNEVRDLGEKAGALAAERGVHQQTYVLEGNGSRPSHKGDGYAESDVMYTLNVTEHHAVAYRKTSHAKSAEDGQGWAETEVNDTLNAFDSGETRTPTVVLENHPQDSRVKISEDGNVPMVMEEPYNATTGSFMRARNSGVAETLAARDYKDTQIVCNSVVRRLTPLECERLQGYPDHWTDIGDWVDSKGKKHKGESDSPRYKALGNSIALPFWQWMAERMVKYIDGHQPTMASLFSGIGGFELVFARAGCKPVWNSEIESYPEAVTRVHFGDDERGIKGDYEKYL